MKFHRLAFAAFGCTVGFFSNSNGFAFADDTAAAESTPVETSEEEVVNYAFPEGSETFEYQAEVNRMLDIVINSLYQNRDVFLRELISNASDALDKMRFLAIEKPELLEQKEELGIRIQCDEVSNSVTIVDSGIGMTREELTKNLGTVARSGTTKFLEALEDGADIGQIGMFGVGFYSAFLVADRVKVASKHPGESAQYVWESVNGESSFHVYEDPRGDTLGRGTEITLYLKEDASEYLLESKLNQISGYYSEFISHPIHVRQTKTEMVPVEKAEEIIDEVVIDEEDDDVTDEKDEDDDDEEDEEEEATEPEMEEVVTHSWRQVNSNKPIWTREKDDITDDEYQSFWKAISKGSSNSTSWTHFDAEGTLNFRSILYLPSEIPQELKMGQFDKLRKGIVKLYVRKVLISDEFELLPSYLSFIRGVVDSDDLSLNVNRETLQESKIIRIIQKKLVRKCLELLRKLSKDKHEPKEEEEEEAEVEMDSDGNVIKTMSVGGFDEEKAPADEHPYITFYKKFHPSLKLGIMKDSPNQNKIAKLLRFKSSKTSGENDWVSFEQYLERKKDWQEEIYYISGTSIQDLEDSHFMEKFTKKDVEVIYFTDPVDEYMLGSLLDFDGKKFKSIQQEGIKFPDEDVDLGKRRQKVYKEKFKPLIKYFKDTLKVMRVDISSRLENAPAVVSAAQYGKSANMERIMKFQIFSSDEQRMMFNSMRILEINPRHPLVVKLLDLVTPPEGLEDDFIPDDETEDMARVFFDSALLNSGFIIDDTKSHSARFTRMMKSSMNLDSLELAEEINPPPEEENDGDDDDESDPLDFDFDSMPEGFGMGDMDMGMDE